jgi:hypothetical protein
MSSVVFTVKSEQLQAELQAALQPDDNKDREAIQAAKQFFQDIASGKERATVQVQTGSADPVAASGTFTLVSAIATDAVTLGTVTLTASSTPANENEWEIDGADDTADALALANAINAHSVLSLVVSASSALGVVTVTHLSPGVVGNQFPISSADATITASGAFLTGGTGGATEAGSTFTKGIS